jgi:hypothetical protein
MVLIIVKLRKPTTSSALHGKKIALYAICAYNGNWCFFFFLWRFLFIWHQKSTQFIVRYPLNPLKIRNYLRNWGRPGELDEFPIPTLFIPIINQDPRLVWAGQRWTVHTIAGLGLGNSKENTPWDFIKNLSVSTCEKPIRNITKIKNSILNNYGYG